MMRSKHGRLYHCIMRVSLVLVLAPISGLACNCDWRPSRGVGEWAGDIACRIPSGYHVSPQEDTAGREAERYLTRGWPVDGWIAGYESLLHTATRNGHLLLAHYLIVHDADVNSRDRTGDTPLSLAAVAGKKELCALFLATERATVLSLNQALVNAADPDTATMLLEAGADIQWVAESGTTALHVAACKGNASLVELLIERGAEVNKSDAAGRTALHHAAFGGDDESAYLATIGTLLKHGADRLTKDASGRTAQDVAVDRKQAMLSAHLGANLNTRDSPQGRK